MNTVIYYFTATGNSLVAAKDLAAELGNAGTTPIVQALKNEEYEMADMVGIAFPVYMFGLPLIVAEFLRKLKVKNGAYVFTLATLGGLPGLAHTQAKGILAKRGIRLAAGFSVLMPGNYIPLYGALPEDKQQKMFEKEKIRIKEIAAFIRQKKDGYLEQKPFLPSFILSKLLYKGGSSQIPLSAKGFWANDDCTKCGLCARICPVSNIEMKDGPVWLNHCQHCMACLQWCPVQAIQYKKSTAGKRRYQHPQVSAKDIISQKE